MFSKSDLASDYAICLEDYTDPLEALDNADNEQSIGPPKLQSINKMIYEALEEFGTLYFHTVNINEEGSMGIIIKEIDNANGYTFHLGTK